MSKHVTVTLTGAEASGQTGQISATADQVLEDATQQATATVTTDQ